MGDWWDRDEILKSIEEDEKRERDRERMETSRAYDYVYDERLGTFKEEKSNDTWVEQLGKKELKIIGIITALIFFGIFGNIIIVGIVMPLKEVAVNVNAIIGILLNK